MKFINLGAGKSRVEAAGILAQEVQVLIHSSSRTESDYLRRHGFVRAVRQFHVLDSTGRCPLSYTRRQRRVLREQEERYRSLRCDVELLTGDSIDIGMASSIYHSVVLTWMDRSEVTPHAWLTKSRFVRSLRGGLVVLTTMDSVPVGVALYRLRPARHFTTSDARFMKLLVSGVVPVGIFRADLAASRQISRVWYARVREKFATHGVDVISFGGDDGFIDAGYSPVVLDKLYWGEQVGWLQERQDELWTNPTAKLTQFPLVMLRHKDSLVCACGDSEFDEIAKKINARLGDRKSK